MKKNYLLLVVILITNINLFAQKNHLGIRFEEYKESNNKGPLIDCDTIFSFPTYDDVPAGLVFDGAYFYSIGCMNGEIFKYNLSGQLMGTLPAPGLDPGGDIDVDGNFLWIVNEQDRAAYKLDKTNGNVLDTILLPTSSLGDPNNFGCAIDNGYLWSTEYLDQTLMRIDTSNGHVIDSFAIHRSIMAVKIINNNLYGIEFTDGTSIGPIQLDKFDKTTGAVIDSIPWCLTFTLGICWADNHFWALSSGYGIGTKTIYEFDNLISSIKPTVPLKSSISVFPNPATSKISVSSSEEINQVDIYNILGELVYNLQISNQKIPVEIDISNFQKGVYLIKINNNSQICTRKMVVN